MAGQRYPDKLDVSLPAARAFAADLLDELLKLFPGPWWHAGMDEYLGIASTPLDYERFPQLAAYARGKHGPGANGKDAVLDFANELGARVRAAGKELRVWSDGLSDGSAVRLDPRTVVEWWENLHSPAPADLVAAGHRVLNAGWWPTYYVTGGPLMGLRAPESLMYETWTANRFEGPYTTRWFGLSGDTEAQVLDAAEPKLLGATVNVWNDVPGNMAQDAIAEGIAPRLRVLAQRTWGSPDVAPGYEAFSSRQAG